MKLCNKKLIFGVFSVLLLLLMICGVVNADVPTQGVPILNSTFALNTTSENLTVYNISTEDVDNDTVKNIYTWYRNNTPFMVLQLPFTSWANTSTAIDYSGFGNNVSGVNSPVFNSTGGYDGFGAYEFNGINQYLRSNTPALSTCEGIINNGFTVTYWIKPYLTNGTGGTTIFSYEGGATTRNYDIRFSILNQTVVWITNGTSRTSYNSNYTITVGQWNFISIIYKQDTVLGFSTNGQFENASYSPLNLSCILRNITIGSQFGGAATFFNGTIDDLTIYNTTLTNEQILAIYNNNTNVMTSSMLKRGDTWNASIVPNDKTSDGEISYSKNLTINRLPTQGTPILNSTFGFNNSDENITVYNITTVDLDSDSIRNIISWYRNNTPIMLLNVPFELFTNTISTKDYSGFNRIVNVDPNSIKWNSSAGYDGRGAYDFDGTNTTEAINISNFPTNISSGISIVGWIKLNSLNKNYNIYGGCQFPYLGVVSTNKLRFDYRNSLSATKASVSNITLSANTWYHVGVSLSPNSSVIMYINGQNVNTTFYNQGVDTTISSIQYIGNTQNICGGAYFQKFNGTIDDIKVYNMSLTPQQIVLMYNNRTDIIDSSMLIDQDGQWNASITPNDGKEDGSTIMTSILNLNKLKIFLLSPANGTTQNSLNQQFQFNVTTAGTTICSLYTNVTGSYVNYTSVPPMLIVQNLATNFFYDNISEIKSIYWDVICKTPVGTEFSSGSNFTLNIDRTNPILIFNKPVRTNSTVYLTSDVNLNLSCNDFGSNLFEFQVNITNSTGQSIYLNYTTDITSNEFNFTPIINFTDNSSGVYRLNFQCSDDHTAKIIPVYESIIDKVKQETTFETESNTNVSIKLVYSDVDLIDIETSKEIDRYRFAYTFEPVLKEKPVKEEPIEIFVDEEYTFIYQILSNSKIYYRNKSMYTAHFVTGQNWIDFEGVNGNFTVYQNLTGWYVKLVTSEMNQNFSSIGGLNIVEENVSFNYTPMGILNISYITPQTPSNRSFVSGLKYINVSSTYLVTNISTNVSRINIYFDNENRTECSGINNCWAPINFTSYSYGVYAFNATVYGLYTEYNYTDTYYVSNNPVYTINDTVMSTIFAFEKEYSYSDIPSDDSNEVKYRYNATINFTSDALTNLTSIIYVFPISRLTSDFSNRNTNYDTAYVDGIATSVTYSVYSNNVTINCNRSLSSGNHYFVFDYSRYYGGQTSGGGSGGGGGGRVLMTVLPNVTTTVTYPLDGTMLTESDILAGGGVIGNITDYKFVLYNTNVQYNSFSDISGDLYMYKGTDLFELERLPTVSILDDNRESFKKANVTKVGIGHYIFTTSAKDLIVGNYTIQATAYTNVGFISIYKDFKVVELKLTWMQNVIDFVEQLDIEKITLGSLLLLFFIAIIIMVAKRYG